MEINIGLTDSVRQQIAQNLSLLLADMYILCVKTQNFYWNVVDPRFYSLYLFFKKEIQVLEEGISEIGERIRELGEFVPGSLKQFLNMTSLTESDGDLIAEDMLTELLKDHEMICRFLRDRIVLASRLGDEGTAKLLIQHLCTHEKSAWILRSHLFYDAQE
jgi:starvation-inducible DNA-binding protein